MSDAQSSPFSQSTNLDPPRSETVEEENDQDDPSVVGRFAAATSDDNSVAVGEEGFVGVAPEYQNFADVTNQPFYSEDEDQKEIEVAAAEREVDLAQPVVPTNPARTYQVDETPASERKKPQDAYIEGNREIMRRAVEGGR